MQVIYHPSNLSSFRQENYDYIFTVSRLDEATAVENSGQRVRQRRLPGCRHLGGVAAGRPPEVDGGSNGQYGEPKVYNEYVDDLLTRKAVDYIHQRALNAKAGNPFFLYLPINAPHTPIAPAPEWQGKSRLNPYGDFVMQVDWSVGQVLAALDQTVLAEDTLAGEICRRRPQHAGDCTVEQ